MKTYTEIYQPESKNYIYIIRDGNNRVTATQVYNFISMGYMGVELTVWDDNFHWLYRNEDLVKDLYPDPRAALKQFGFNLVDATDLELAMYRKEFSQ